MMSESEQNLWRQLETDVLSWAMPSRLIWWRGSDARSWLQGQITQDVRLVSASSPQQFCVCSATGQLLGEGLLFEEAGELGAIVDSQTLGVLMERVKDFVILEDVELQVTEDFVWTSQGPTAEGRARWDATGRGGFVSWGPTLPMGVLEHPPGIATVARLEAGIPRFGVDSGARTLPPELGPWFDQTHVSHAKGCYTGQEVLHRIFARGHTNKSWVVASTQSLVEPVDWVTSSGVSPLVGPLVAGIVRNDVATVGSRIAIADQVAEVITPPKGLLG